MLDHRVEKLRSYKESLICQDRILMDAMRAKGNYAVPVPGAAPIIRLFKHINADFPDLLHAFSYHAQPAALRAQILEAVARIDSKSQEIQREAESEAMKNELAAPISAVTASSTNEKLIGNKIFLGHGRSKDWIELKDFVQDRPHLPWDEFNREPTAGLSTKRLNEMLNGAGFALLVMTAEDERADGTKHARKNVIHEAGLFQGRSGFKRAIILLEEDCPEFSNIHGLTQLRFPRGRIQAVFEEVRRVLEREGILAKV